MEVPRSLWNNSKSGFTLQHAYFKTAKLSSEKAEAEENVDTVVESLLAASRSIPTQHEMRVYVETILRKVPLELVERASRNIQRSDISSTIIPLEKSLVRLHKQVIKALQTLQRTEALWTVQVNKVLYLEDVARNCFSMDRSFRCEYPPSRSRIGRILYNPVLDWYWQCMLKPPFYKALAVATGMLSLMVVWSELTFFNRSPVLSIFANVVNLAKTHYDFLTIEIFSMATLCYLCYCAYSTIFRIKFLNLYYLAPHHQTNEHSLIFSGMLLCRLTPPMCLNFLGLIHMDSHIIKMRILETYYTQVMGHMDVLGIIADGFNIYFPMVMLAFCLATWFSIGSRALNALGFQQFMLNESIAAELVQEGRDLIGREKRKRQRFEESQLRRRGISGGDGGKGVGGGAGGNGGGTVGGGSGAFTKFRTRPTDTIIGPGDGLLRDAETFDYSTANNTTDISRSLSQEINERFGASTQVQIGFRGYDSPDDDDGEDRFQKGTSRGGQPPRGLFDDV